MVEERQQFPKRWPHLTTLYNASPFMSTTRSYKEVDEWNSLRPLPTPNGGYPPSYEDTYSRDVFASYNPQRHISGDKFGRGYANSNYDAFSMSTYHTAPHFRKQKVSRTTHFLSCAIGISLMLALVGAITAVVIVLRNGSNCDSYADSVWVLESSYDHSKLMTDSDINYNFTRDFCYELETAFRTYFTEDHMCGCRTVEISIDGPDALVSFNIDYRRISEKDKNETYVGRRLAITLNKIINESRTPSFALSYNWPGEVVTKAPMSSVGNETLMANGTDFDDILNSLDSNETIATVFENETNSVLEASNSSIQAPIDGQNKSSDNVYPGAKDGSDTLQSLTETPEQINLTTTTSTTTLAPTTNTVALTTKAPAPSTQSTASSSTTTAPTFTPTTVTPTTLSTSQITSSTTTTTTVATTTATTTTPLIVQAPPNGEAQESSGNPSQNTSSPAPSASQAGPVTGSSPVLPNTNGTA